MRKNIYTSLETFIDEYATGKSFSWQNPDGVERFMGIEFCYRDYYYRLCNEPKGCVPEGAKGRFHVVEMIIEKGERYPFYDHYDEIGWYATLNDVLKECMIQNTPFEEVIMDTETEILSQD